MQHSTTMEQQFCQLRDVLQSPLIPLDADNDAATFLDVKDALSRSTHCCIIVATSTSASKFQNIRNLNRSMSVLKDLQRQFCTADPMLRASIIGIYPSLEYPACVYELRTSADRYITNNVLPYAGSTLKRTVKHLISSLLGANPAVGGLGLALYKE